MENKVIVLLKGLRLLAFRLFLVLNPLFLVLIFIVSFFSRESALNCLEIQQVFFLITLVFATPQIITYYRAKNEK